MKKLFLLFLLLFSLIGCSNLNKTTTPRNGTLKTFYKNGNCEKIENYKEGFLNGEYIEFFKNSNIKSRITYKEGKKEGLSQSFYENGNLKERGLYKNGLRVGIWTYFNEDKSIRFKINFENEGYFNPETYNIPK
ncbi:toxin-antitoxin system YwqK family antitoxin [Fusobacterium sp. MFO224]|uniref:toxin-antitoxin system YwqK family antitoxin n=1 Tax=Fusobacterium sp. MFO224 TaxID=3378070 RepID=UPI003854A3C9